MKLLFDQNLSYLLVSLLAEYFPDSNHVRLLNLESATDQEIWNFARKEAYTIVTQDSDFLEMSVLFGPPPKIIWIRCGNIKTQNIHRLLIQKLDPIRAFLEDPTAGCLEIFETKE